MALISLVSCGVEKAALKLLPRAHASRPALVAGFLVIGGLLGLPFLAWAGAAALWGGPGVDPLQLAVVP
jgi:hypothetical protein